MLTAFKLEKDSIEYLDWLGQSISECEMPPTLRVRVACACFAIAQDHHHGIVTLLDRGLFASSFALLRWEYEAYIRGEWLSLCATDEEVTAFSEDKEPPKIQAMLGALEATPAFSEKILSRIHAESWKTMNSYTHTGGLHVQKWGTTEVIEPSYTPEEIQEVLYLAEAFGAFAVAGIAELAKDEQVQEAILAKVQVRAAK